MSVQWSPWPQSSPWPQVAPKWRARVKHETKRLAKQLNLSLLFKVHAGFAALHILSAAALLTLYFTVQVEELEGVLTSDAGGELETLDGYQIFWVLWPMPVLTGIFHAFQAVLIIANVKWYTDPLGRKQNLVRWIEYSITASLMTWIVAQLSGVTNFVLLVMVAIVMNIALQVQGYIYEISATKWPPMVAGLVLFCGQWTTIGSYFFRAVLTADAPAFVWVIFVGLFITFLGFPSVQLASPLMTWKQYEIVFVVLSAISKLLLDWTLFFGILSV
jgi:hypothetical protein